MDANFLEKFITYREKNKLQLAKIIISAKIKNQYVVVGKRALGKPFLSKIGSVSDVTELLLLEARAAKSYWKWFGLTIEGKIIWLSRKPRANDIANQLLDIGYHHLAETVSKLLTETNLPSELGFIHRANRAKSQPFVYDFMEWLRPIIVDRVIIRILHKKKLPVKKLSNRLIKILISEEKDELQKKYYHRQLGYCVTLEYWIRLMLLSLRRSVDDQVAPNWTFPSLRHESRCSEKALAKAKARADS